MSTPTLINLPPPPSDPATPSEIPGTPNSGTTTMSELSTVAIKDGHRGHPHHHHLHEKGGPSSTLEAERADRISRLAGMERVTTARPASQNSLPVGASAASQDVGGYFGYAPVVPPTREKERSTVGSASATGSVGGRTTWASGSDQYDAADKMSEDMETSSAGGFSDENASLVGFGETASSTVSGPVSSGNPGLRTPQRQSAGKISPLTPASGSAPMQGVSRDPRAEQSMEYEDGTPPAAPYNGSTSNDRMMTDGYEDDDQDEYDEDVGMAEPVSDGDQRRTTRTSRRR